MDLTIFLLHFFFIGGVFCAGFTLGVLYRSKNQFLPENFNKEGERKLL